MTKYPHPFRLIQLFERLAAMRDHVINNQIMSMVMMELVRRAQAATLGDLQ